MSTSFPGSLNFPPPEGGKMRDPGSPAYFSSLLNLFVSCVCRHYFEGYPQLAEQTTYLTEYIDLLEQQIKIEVKTTPV